MPGKIYLCYGSTLSTLYLTSVNYKTNLNLLNQTLRQSKIPFTNHARGDLQTQIKNLHLMTD